MGVDRGFFSRERERVGGNMCAVKCTHKVYSLVQMEAISFNLKMFIIIGGNGKTQRSDDREQEHLLHNVYFIPIVIIINDKFN